MPWLPDYPVAEDKCWRIAYGIKEKELQYYSNGNYQKLTMNYYLLKEKEWQKVCNTIQKEDVTLYNSLKEMNPHNVRPSFLK